MALEVIELNTLRSVEDLTSYQKEVRGRIGELNTEHAGLPFPEEAREEYARLKDSDVEIERRVTELEARKRDVERISQTPANVEREMERNPEARGSTKERDIYDLSTIRANFANPESMRSELTDRARRAVEISDFPLTRSKKDVATYGLTTDQAREHVEGLLERDNDRGDFARYLLATGDPAYRRAYVKAISAGMRGVSAFSLTREEQAALERGIQAERALSLGTTGIPIPYQLDPTVIPTSNFSVNPWRAICSVEQIVVNEWRGATSGAITAAYAAEGTEASDNTPTMTQPTIAAVRAQAFVPFSIESGQDWGALQESMARLIADAKDDLESGSTGFFGGNGTNQPTGLNAMSSGTDSAVASAGAFAIADLYTLEAALPPRFRPRASIVGNRLQYSRVRQFDTAGGAGLWLYIGEQLNHGVPTPGRTGASLLGYAAYEASQMLSVLTTGSRIFLIGDFSYYKIVDRVGMSIEVIPHLFGSGNRFPTGQRGLYAFWRNGGKTLSESAFKFLKT
jgi:HK97 family phage major capsid protein